MDWVQAKVPGIQKPYGLFYKLKINIGVLKKAILYPDQTSILFDDLVPMPALRLSFRGVV